MWLRDKFPGRLITLKWNVQNLNGAFNYTQACWQEVFRIYAITLICKTTDEEIFCIWMVEKKVRPLKIMRETSVKVKRVQRPVLWLRKELPLIAQHSPQSLFLGKDSFLFHLFCESKLKLREKPQGVKGLFSCCSVDSGFWRNWENLFCWLMLLIKKSCRVARWIENEE